MCGIAGIIAKKNLSEQKFDDFIESSKLMNHRGPDHMGYVRFENVLLIHYRLSIIDLDARSNQPFNSKSNVSVCVYNGEIYNYNELKPQLGFQTRTTSDTEVMIESYEKFGINIVKDWNGIFALSVLNKSTRSISLIRDRFGVKPLYYYEDSNVILFASEAKVIFNWLPYININLNGLSQYLWFGNTISNETMVDKVKKIEPASVLEIDIKTFQKKSTYYYNLPGTRSQSEEVSSHVKNIKSLLKDAVRRQLISDVPIGILLSGGIDSSALVGLASQELGSKLDTYSVEYDYNAGGKSELELANLVAKKYKTNHHELKIISKNIPDLFSSLVFQYDEPFFDPANIPLYQLGKETSRDKKVILQGDGGDEVFAGYRRYNITDWLKFWQYTTRIVYPFIHNKNWKERVRRMSHIVNQRDNGLRMAYFLSLDVPYKSPYNSLSNQCKRKLNTFNPFKPYQSLDLKYQNEDLVQRLLYADMEILLPNTYLEKVDKATMLSSVESRVPFLDNNLTDYVLGLPSSMKVKNGSKKYLLKKVLRGIVPNEILFGKKRGFDVPFSTWLKRDLFDFAYTTFEEIPENSILNKDKLITLLNDHKSEKANYGAQLWKMLVLAEWMKLYKSKIQL